MANYYKMNNTGGYGTIVSCDNIRSKVKDRLSYDDAFQTGIIAENDILLDDFLEDVKQFQNIIDELNSSCDKYNIRMTVQINERSIIFCKFKKEYADQIIVRFNYNMGISETSS